MLVSSQHFELVSVEEGKRWGKMEVSGSWLLREPWSGPLHLRSFTLTWLTFSSCRTVTRALYFSISFRCTFQHTRSLPSPGPQHQDGGRPRLGGRDMTQALIPDSLAYDVTFTKSLNCSGLIFLCRMKSSLKIPSGSFLPITQIGR